MNSHSKHVTYIIYVIGGKFSCITHRFPITRICTTRNVLTALYGRLL